MDFDPLFSYVHCGISLEINNTFKCLEGRFSQGQRNNENFVTSGKVFPKRLKPGKWDKRKTNEYIQNIDHDFVTQVVDSANTKSVADLNEDLKKIFIEPAKIVFPQKKIYIKKK